MNAKLRTLLVALLVALSFSCVKAQQAKVYDESIDPFCQIEDAVAQAAASGRYVVCQLGGNWCPWCLRFARFIEADDEIRQLIADNFVYIHVNYRSRQDELSQRVSRRLGNAGRFGFPVLVILRPDGSVLHIQDSSYLEQDKGYDRARVLAFFQHWTPAAVSGK